MASIIIHEAAHVIAALSSNAQFGELKFGFHGINPSVTLPERLAGGRLTAFHYVGGLTSGAVLLLIYFLHWVRLYRRKPSFFIWGLGLVTATLIGMQLAIGYLEGRYHGAYIIGATSVLSPTNILIYGWGLSAVFFHMALCPMRKMRINNVKPDVIRPS
jgi:hypothetical protein